MPKEGVPITPDALKEAEEAGFEAGFFKDGKPEKLVMRRGAEFFTADGELVGPQTKIKLGIFKRAK